MIAPTKLAIANAFLQKVKSLAVPPTVILQQITRAKSTNKNIDYSKVPELNEEDLVEKYIGGWGPGGQGVNKAINCCFLKHKPTGLFVKTHHSRDLQKNRQEARELLKYKLDDLLNGEDSVSQQKLRIASRGKHQAEPLTEEQIEEAKRKAKERERRKSKPMLERRHDDTWI